MIYLIISIVCLFVLVVAFKLTKSKPTNTSIPEHQEAPSHIAGDCCGAHEICEFDESIYNEEPIEYFDDEELDELRNISEDLLTNLQIDNLREVLYTLKTKEINKWILSLGRRHIHLPEILKQEARQLMTGK